MQNIPFHIAYLLIQHECVIVPGLGAFVVSSSDREKTNQQGFLSPPKNFLGFNPEIKHNDGLLADSIVKEKSFSFKEANLLINQYVRNLLISLDRGKKVQIPGVGTFYSIDNKRLFQPDRILSCNALYYGLSGFSMPYLRDLKNPHLTPNIFPEKKDKEIVLIPVNRKFISYCGSIAAAFIAMCFIPTPLNNSRFSSSIHTRYASIIDLSMQNRINEETDVSEPKIQTPTDLSLSQAKVETPSRVEIEIPSQTETETLLQAETVTSARPKIVKPTKSTAFHYYIIVASSPNQSLAKKSLANVQSKFKNAAVLFSDNKYRIYVKRFEDKTEAIMFLDQFRKDNPKQYDAWLLKQKG